MEANIEETAIVYPSTPPFSDDHILSLSSLDVDRNLQFTFRYLRVYTSINNCSGDRNPFLVIVDALSRLLISYYPLTGTLRRRHVDDRLELHCHAGEGVPVIRATVDCSLSSINYLDDPHETFVEQLAPNPNLEEALTRPFVLQVTEFGCGGWVLGAAIHHSLCDGLGATVFFSAMAELARGADRIVVEPVWDRVRLLGPRNPTRVEFPIGEFLDLQEGSSPYSDPGSRVLRRSFEMEEKWLNRLKGILYEESGSKYTTFEALGAFIWRARVKSSKVPGNEKVKFAYAMNIRKIIKPELPAGHWGNGCVPMYVQLLAKDLVEQPLWKTAEMIKKSKFDAGDEYVRSFIDFQELHYREGITGGRRVTGVTDWRHLGHSKVDFGWGGPVTVLPLSRHLLGSVEPCFFLPYSSAIDGKKDGFKVLVHLQEDAMPACREEMDKLKYPG